MNVIFGDESQISIGREDDDMFGEGPMERTWLPA